MTRESRERPILMSGPMVRALLDGTKTQTRRVMKPQPPEESARFAVEWYAPVAVDRHGEEYPGPDIFGAYSLDGEWGLRCPYGAPGDRLWLKERWASMPCYDHLAPRDIPQHQNAILYATRAPEKRLLVSGFHRLRSPIHMPRWASRLTLEITEVRVQRVQEMRFADFKAEGMSTALDGRYAKGMHEFRTLWDSLNAKRGHGWSQNPWVWALTVSIAPPPETGRAR